MEKLLALARWRYALMRDGGTGTGLPALREISSQDYHADRIDPDRPTLSKSIIQLLIERSPAHARVAHPRLNPGFQRVEDDRFDLGTTVHSMFLEGTDAVAVIPYDDWRTKAAKELRDDARANGLIAMLASQYDECCQMVEALRAQCDTFPLEPALFTEGVAEGVLTWEEDGVLCRCRPDWLRNDLAACDDLKTAARSANPEAWSKTAFSIYADVQSAFYARGLRANFGKDIPMRFVVVETSPPYAMSVVEMGPDVLLIANKKIDYALNLWRRCLDSGEWPSYEQRVASLELPTWEENRWLAREIREAA